MREKPNEEAANPWENFWAVQSDPTKRDAIHLPALSPLWNSMLAEVVLDTDEPIALELAAGSGSISLYIINAASLQSTTKIAFDVSLSALTRCRYGESAVVGNLERLPFLCGSVDLLTSQFGVEYAGMSFISDALSCVADGGFFAFVMHIKDGVIDRECGVNRQLVEDFMSSSFLQSAEALINTSLGAQLSPDHQRRAQVFRERLSRAEQLLIEAAAGQAKDTLMHVYNAVADMVEAPRHYDLAVVDQWFLKTKSELVSYVQRMSQMQESAFSEEDRSALMHSAESNGFNIIRQGIVLDGDGLQQSAPVAWHILAQRTEDSR